MHSIVGRTQYASLRPVKICFIAKIIFMKVLPKDPQRGPIYLMLLYPKIQMEVFCPVRKGGIAQLIYARDADDRA